MQSVWSNFTKAVNFLEQKVDETGLVDITGLRDWARLGGGGHNSEGNALFYEVLFFRSNVKLAINAVYYVLLGSCYSF